MYTWVNIEHVNMPMLHSKADVIVQQLDLISLLLSSTNHKSDSSNPDGVKNLAL